MRTLLISALCSLSFLSSSAGIFGTVRVNIHNKTSKKISLEVCRGKATDVDESLAPIYVTDIASNSQLNDIKLPKAKKNDQLVFLGKIEGVTNKVRFTKKSVSKGNETLEIVLDMDFKELPPNTSADEALSNLDPHIPKNSSMYGTIDNIYDTKFGGLVLMNTNIDGTKTPVVTISPLTLKGRAKPNYSAGNVSTDIYSKGTFSAQAKLGLPVLGVNGSGNNETWYKFTYTFTGANVQNWSAENNRSLPQLFAELPEVDRIALITQYLTDTTRKLFQYDHAYIFKILSVTVEKYEASNSTVDVSALGYFSGGVASTNKKTDNYVNNQTDMVMNLWYENDYTSLLTQAAAEYLQKKLQPIIKSTTTTQAQTVVNASLSTEERKALDIQDNASKAEIVHAISENIEALKTKAENNK